MTHINYVTYPIKESKETDFRRIQCEFAEVGFQIVALTSAGDWLIDSRQILIRAPSSQQQFENPVEWMNDANVDCTDGYHGGSYCTYRCQPG